MNKSDTSIQADAILEEVLELFRLNGDSMYGGEGVTQIEHGLQAAMLAEEENASPELIVAALLHDVGHLLHELPDDAPDRGIDDVHEELGAKWLEGRFPESVLEPVRMHVDSKRYLCATEPGYWDSLSEPSKISLELQAGIMNEQECSDFRSNPFFDDAIRLRRWDDLAKVVGLEMRPLDHFTPFIRQVLVEA